MGKLQQYIPFFVASLLLAAILVLIYPHYQYYIDPDGTAYLTISQRYATGDIGKAINGYWSPWACWLTALVIRAGISPIPSSVIINALAAAGFLFISQSLFLRFGLIRKVQYVFCITLALFLCYAVFWQSFDDLWECFFLLAALRLMVTTKYRNRPGLWAGGGLLGAMAYFAKAYSFPFFILNTACCAWIVSSKNFKQSLKIWVTSCMVMLLCSFPWICTLHHKYGFWTTSTSGPLNMSWYLVGHPVWKDGIRLLIPPVYGDSPYYWEDPWFANGPLPHFWDSFSLFGELVLRGGYHVLLFLLSTFQLSVFFPLVVLITCLSLITRNKKQIPTDLKIVSLSFVLFPAGYFLVNFEARYLWYMVPLGMVIGTLDFQNITHYWLGIGPRESTGPIHSANSETGCYKQHFKIPNSMVTGLFALSFLIYPAWCMVKMFNDGKTEYLLAQQFKQLQIRGSMTGSIPPRFMARLAYFSGNPYYFLLKNKRQYPITGIMDEVNRYKIDYYIFTDDFEDHSPDHEVDFRTEIRPHATEVMRNDESGIRVFRINYKN